MFCRKCGTQIPEDSIFCSKCGTKVESSGEDKTNNDNTVQQHAQSEFVCPSCGGRVTIDNGIYVCHSGCGYTYNPNEQSVNPSVSTNDANDNISIQKQPFLSKKQLIILLVAGILGFIASTPAWYMDLIAIAIVMIAFNFGMQAKTAKKWGKLGVIIVTTIIAFIICAAAKGAISADIKSNNVKSGLQSILGSTKKAPDINILKEINISQERKDTVFSIGDETYGILKDRIYRLDDNEYSCIVAIESPKNKNLNNAFFTKIDLKTKQIQFMGLGYYNNKGQWVKTENSDAKPVNISNNTPPDGILKYILSGKTSRKNPIIAKEFLNLGSIKWGASKADVCQVFTQAAPLPNERFMKKEDSRLEAKDADIKFSGLPVERLVFNFTNDRLKSITVDLVTKFGFTASQAEMKNSLNKSIDVSKILFPRLNAKYNTAIRQETLLSNEYLNESEEFKQQRNSYRWWTSESNIEEHISATISKESNNYLFIYHYFMLSEK